MKKPRPIGTGPKPRAIRSELRLRCERRVARLVEVAKASLWTRRQVRHEMRAARLKMLSHYLPDDVVGRRRVSSAWYRAIRAVCGAPLRKMADLRQIELKWRTT